jgi:hypothetical protein
MLLDAERAIVVFVLAHHRIFKNQETNGAVKSLTDNNLEATLFIAKLVLAARHYWRRFIHRKFNSKSPRLKAT